MYDEITTAITKILTNRVVFTVILGMLLVVFGNTWAAVAAELGLLGLFIVISFNSFIEELVDLIKKGQ